MQRKGGGWGGEVEVERAAQTGAQGGPLQGCALRLEIIMLLAGEWVEVGACHCACATAC
jgi:hypothetical protein